MTSPAKYKRVDKKARRLFQTRETPPSACLPLTARANQNASKTTHENRQNLQKHFHPPTFDSACKASSTVPSTPTTPNPAVQPTRGARSPSESSGLPASPSTPPPPAPPPLPPIPSLEGLSSDKALGSPCSDTALEGLSPDKALRAPSWDNASPVTTPLFSAALPSPPSPVDEAPPSTSE